MRDSRLNTHIRNQKNMSLLSVHHPLRLLIILFSAVEKQASKVRKTVDSMHSQGAAYFAAWEQDSALFQNPDLKSQAEKRRIELQNDYKQINAYL